MVRLRGKHLDRHDTKEKKNKTNMKKNMKHLNKVAARKTKVEADGHSNEDFD